MEKTLIFLNKISKTSKTCNVTVFIPNTEKNTVTYILLCMSISAVLYMHTCMYTYNNTRTTIQQNNNTTKQQYKIYKQILIL